MRPLQMFQSAVSLPHRAATAAATSVELAAESIDLISLYDTIQQDAQGNTLSGTRRASFYSMEIDTKLTKKN